MNKQRFAFWAIALAAIFQFQTARAENTAIQPVPRDEKWMQRHEGFLEETRKGGYDLIFIGDSITDGWRGKGKAVWDKYYAPRKALNLGIGGDRTQHVLWRLQNGEVEGLKPKAVVLLIGVNNTPIEKDGKPRNTVPEIIEGVGAVVKDLQKRLPKSKILLLAVFPYKQKDHPMRDTVKQINAGIKKFAKGKKVQFLDIGEKFLDPDGTMPKEVMPDLLHPNEKGYQIWAEAIEPTLVKMMK